MKLLRLLPLLAALLWASGAYAADPNTGLSVTSGSGTTLCAFTGTGTITQIYTCTVPIIQNSSGVGAVVSTTNPMPITSVVPAGGTVVSNSASSTTTAATTIIAAVVGQKAHVTSGQCWNNSTTQNTVTFNDTAGSSLLVPPGGTVPLLLQPGTYLIGATNTAITMTQASPAQTTVTCNLQGYTQ